MGPTVRDTIKSITKEHLSGGSRCYGQCLTAVGWVGGTLPRLYEKDGMTELSMADVAGGGIVVGAALAGERPIYVVRYQGFQWYNSPIIANYAMKSKEIWQRPCPLLVRSIAMEGGIGPVALITSFDIPKNAGCKDCFTHDAAEDRDWETNNGQGLCHISFDFIA